MKKMTMEYIQAYDEARKARDSIIDYYGGAVDFANRLDITPEAIRMWRSRSVAIPEGNAWKIVAWGDFSFSQIRPDLK